jgi:hypothetical protein
MNSFKATVLAIFCGLLSWQRCTPKQQLQYRTPRAHPPPNARDRAHAGRFSGLSHARPSSSLRFLASEEGRSYLQAIGHPIAPYAIQVFGAAFEERRSYPTRGYREFEAEQQSQAEQVPTGTTSCTGAAGVRFNLEPQDQCGAAERSQCRFSA